MGRNRCGKSWAMVLAGLAALAGRPALAAPEPLTLKQALRLAQNRHVEVLVADQRVQAAMARIGQAKSVLLPNFDVTASQYRRTVNLETFGIDPQIPGFTFDPKPPPFNVFDARIALRQTLFDLSALRQLKLAKLGTRLSQEDRRRAEADALALTATLYLEAQSAQRTLENTRALVRREEARYRLAGAEREIGLGSDLAVTQSRAALAAVRNQVAGAERDAEERRLDLAAALGLPPEQAIRFPGSVSLGPVAAPGEAEIQSWIDQHPDLAVARRQVDLDRQDRSVEKADYFPKVVGAADYGASGPDPANATDTYNFGAGLSIPLYQGGLREARIREASAKLQESELRLEQLRRDREADVRSALAALKQSIEAQRAARAGLDQSRAALNVSQARRESGLGSELEVVEARREVIASQESLDQADAAYRLAWVNLEHRLGRMQAWLEELPDS
ncbi:MAG TPA: TolC family protein [bacterium]|nr:TolC family protein [bacterium]